MNLTFRSVHLSSVAANGRWSKTWSQYVRIGGNYTSIGLGFYPAVSLAEARTKALANRKELAVGRDPLNLRCAQPEEATKQAIALHRNTWKLGSGAEARRRSAFTAMCCLPSGPTGR